jgi:hypothetical protein
MHTPNIDRLAASGTRFNRAYANYAVCNPSRNSFMTGRVPDNTAVWSFHHSFREIMPRQPTIGSYLRDHGYQTTFGGKVRRSNFVVLLCVCVPALSCGQCVLVAITRTATLAGVSSRIPAPVRLFPLLVARDWP